MDVEAAVDELERSSMVETLKSPSDGEHFLRVPLAAAVFGRRKLAVSALRSAVDADTELLMLFGAARSSAVERGLEPRIRQMTKSIMGRIGDEDALEEGLAILSYVARSYAPAWLSLADVYLAVGNLDEAEAAIQKYLERAPGDIAAWRKLADVRRAQGDILGDIHARVEVADAAGSTHDDASHVANLLNRSLASGDLRLDADEKRVLANRIRRQLGAGIASATATDLSRLAWLCVHLRDQDAPRHTRAWAWNGSRRTTTAKPWQSNSISRLASGGWTEAMQRMIALPTTRIAEVRSYGARAGAKYVSRRVAPRRVPSTFPQRLLETLGHCIRAPKGLQVAEALWRTRTADPLPNRRPAPYHAPRSATGRNRWQRFRLV
jgi:tetratricopeptide (TPR) repeat protein